MASATVVVAEALLLGGWLVGIALVPDAYAGTDPASLIAGGVFIGMVGLVIVGGPMLLVTTSCAIAWAWIVRGLVRRGHGTAGA
jgi:hypothetical protein